MKPQNDEEKEEVKKLSIREKLFETRWNEPKHKVAPVLRKHGHKTMAQAQTQAIAMSIIYGYSQCAEYDRIVVNDVETEEVIKKHGYVAGHEIDLTKDTTKEQAAAISAAQSKLKSRKISTEKETTMATTSNGTAKKPATSAKKVAEAKPARKTGKPKTSAKKPATKGPKTPKEAVGAPGSLLASFGLRAGSKRAAFVSLLCENKGKLLPIRQVLKATYGNQDLNGIGPLAMMIKGATDTIKRNKIAWHIERGKDEKGDLTIGLKAGVPEE